MDSASASGKARDGGRLSRLLRGQGRASHNDPLQNAGVLFQNLAFRPIDCGSATFALEGDKRSWDVLDVGCGSGLSLLRLLACGLDAERLHGIDITEERIARGRRKLPSVRFCGRAMRRRWDYASNSFDLVLESRHCSRK